MKKCVFAALMALAVCGTAVGAGPNLLIDLKAEDFVASQKAWPNKGDLGSEFLPVGDGSGITYGVVGGINAVSLAGSRNSVLTNMVPPSAVCGSGPWSWEVWVYNPVANASAEIVFTWTAREGWPSTGAEGSCMEFRYGSDTGNAVEHYGGNNNLSWNGAIPTVGQWHHVAVTREASGMERLFLDGRLRTSRVPQVLNLRDDVGHFTIGAVRDIRNTNIDGSPFSGSIARLRIYDGTLDTKDVFLNYLAECAEFGFTPDPLDQFWTGTPGTWESWDEPTNWLLGLLPVDNDIVYIDNKGKADGFGGTNTFQFFNGFDGAFRMTNGLMTVLNTVSLANSTGRTFDFQLTGGKFNVPGNNDRHFYMGSGGGAGYATIGGGDKQAWLCVDKDIQLATGNACYGFMKVLPNGLVTVSNGWFYVNCSGVSTGEVVVAGGTIRGERDCRIIVGQGRGAKAKLTVNSGSVEMLAEMRMSGDQALNANSYAEVYLNGGLIWIQRVVAYTPGENYFYLNGGTLRNRDSRQDFFQNLTAAYVQSDGAVFDIIAGTTIGVAQGLLEHPTDTGGGLTKLGAGILELRGANTLTGDITVNEGILLFRNGSGLPSNYSGKILLENGASIGWEKDGGAAALLAQLDKNSVGTILLFGADANKTIDLSQFPYLSIGATGSSVDHGGYVPYTDPVTLIQEYRFTVIANAYVFRTAIPENGRVTLDATSTGFLDLYGDSSYTNGTTINGGFIVIYHENALGAYRGVRDIGIYNGAALVINYNIGQQRVQDVIDRIKLDSYGALLVGNPVNNYAFDLSALPGVSLGSDQNNARDFNGTLTPNPAIGYHIGGGRNTWNNSGLGFRNLPASPYGVVLDIPGSAQLVTNNLFAGGIVVSNTAVLYFQNDTALGAVPPAPVDDYLTISGGALRPNPSFPGMATHPNRGFTVGDNGVIFYPPGNRFMRWLGDLKGSGAITNWDSGTVIFGGVGNTWDGELTLRNGTFAVGHGNAFSWPRDNVIQGDNGFFGVATDNDLGWDANFARPLGDAPVSYVVPGGTSAPIGLRKLGAGTLTLDVPNTYTRDTQIESGTLKVGTANAIPWGGGKGNLNLLSNNLFPLGTLDINGFDVNVNGLSGPGSVTDLQDAGKTLTIGNNNAGGTFWGKIDPTVNVTKLGNNTQNFWKGAEVAKNLTIERGPVNAGAESVFGDVSIKMVATTDNSGFNVGLLATDTCGLTGEYYWFDFPELFSLVTTPTIADLEEFNTFLAQYVPTHVQSSASFGVGFDPASDGSRFQGSHNGRNYFYARWAGEFYAETAGTYRFATASDDGSAVYINGEKVVDNCRDQGYNLNDMRSGDIELEAGWHDIVVAFYQKSSSRGLTVFMHPPGNEEPFWDGNAVTAPPLPQALLRPYPVTVRSLAGILNSRTEVFGNAALLVANEAVNVYSGRLVSATADARFVKDGTDDFIFAEQVNPEFKGQIVVANGDLGLQDAAVSTRPIKIEGGQVLFVEPAMKDWGNLGLKGSFYNTGNYGGGLVDATAVLNAFGSLIPDDVFNTTQAGPDAILNGAANFHYERETFPGIYSYLYPPVSEKSNFRGWFRGKFLALEAGNYVFQLHADDRADLYLNGERICADATYQIENIRTSPPRYLEVGTHDIQVAWGQGGGGYFLRVNVQTPSASEMIRLPNAWLRPSVSTAYGVEGDGTVDMRYPGSYLCMRIEEPQAFAGSIVGAPGSEIEKNGEATWTLLGDNDGFEGGWLILNGTLVVGDDGLDGTLGGRSVYVGANAKLIFNRSDDIVYDGQVSGKGEISSTGGRVTFSNFGSEFQGVFTSGDFVVEGESTMLTPSNLPPAGEDLDLRVQLGGGARLVVPAGADPTLLMAPLTLADATVSLPYAENGVYHIETLSIAAGTTNFIGMDGPTGIVGCYYTLPNGHALTTSNAFLTLEDGIAYLETQTLICKASCWEAGTTFDFGSGDPNNRGGLLFPEDIVTNRVENFGAIYKGKIRITTPGEYRFGTESDDHSMLYINGTIVVDNNGSHGMQWRYGFVTLTPGLHDFAVLYAQGTSGLGLRADITVPGGASVRLPFSMLHMDFANVNVVSQGFTLEIGTLGVVEGPGTGLLDVSGGDLQLGGTLLLNNLFIESVGAVIATKGNTLMKGSHLHVEMGEEPAPGLFFKVGDFIEAIPYGLPLTGKTTSLDGAGRAKLVQRNGCLYISMVTGTILILR